MPGTSGDGDTAVSVGGSTGEPLPGLDEECESYSPLPRCAEGLKCIPQSIDDDSSADHFSCQPLLDDTVGLYESCEWESGRLYRGTDNCGDNAFCRPISSEGDGECTGLCEFEEVDDWSHDTLSCEDPNAFGGVFCQECFCMCLPTCDPIDPSSCEADEMCAGSGYDLFTCAPDASEEGLGNSGDPCEYVNACHHGLACLGADAVPGCESTLGCCAEYCDATDPDAVCPGAREGVECLPWWEDPESAPPGLAHLGVCALPFE